MSPKLGISLPPFYRKLDTWPAGAYSGVNKGLALVVRLEISLQSKGSTSIDGETDKVSSCLYQPPSHSLDADVKPSCIYFKQYQPSKS
jgi:hypothetical protein